jgi:hypothetical protein
MQAEDLRRVSLTENYNWTVLIIENNDWTMSIKLNNDWTILISETCFVGNNNSLMDVAVNHNQPLIVVGYILFKTLGDLLPSNVDDSVR